MGTCIKPNRKKFTQSYIKIKTQNSNTQHVKEYELKLGQEYGETTAERKASAKSDLWWAIG
ncbi:hypothetical protein OUZ56_029839 [Daphnia magna]|uniref:Uncharacterized protein n=1 Tax=Daphnia magna TaxID=35525 RepID=A0ABR0B804_9CRUS|nr:hypothetical protein OUZ56_029839 [Daphnia magna]